MTRATTQKTRPSGDDSELDLSRARVVGRGIHAQRGVHMSLRAVRTAAGKTQVDLSGRTGIAQGDVSRIEQRETLDDLQVSTLRRYVEALGGKLELVAVFPKDHKIKLVGTEKERSR